MTKQIHNITAGPSREELFDALRLRHENRTVKVMVEYSAVTAGDPQKAVDMKYNRTLKVTVDSISVIGNGGYLWSLILTDCDGNSYDASFNTEKRHGKIWLKKKDISWLIDADGHAFERAEHAMAHGAPHR